MTGAVTEFGFYHLTTATFDQAAPRLLERIVAGGQRVVVRVGSPERAAHLNALLWTYDPNGFLPHGAAEDGDPAEQPIWLTAEDENPNGAAVLVVTDGIAVESPAGLEKVLDFFDGGDEAAVLAARGRWQTYRAQGHALTYWQQDEAGRWQARRKDGGADRSG